MSQMRVILFFLFSVAINYSPLFQASSCIVTLQQYLQVKNNIIISEFSKNIEIKNKIKQIVVILPGYLISGGPENLCQIYAALKKLGYEVYCLWINPLDIPGSIIKKYENGMWYLCKTDAKLVNKIYEQNYNVNYLDKDIPLNESTLVIVPEIWTDFIYFFEDAKKAIAWLSIAYLNVDNYSEICNSLIKQKKLAYLDCIHLSQSPWIQKILKSWGADSFLLGDYIANQYFIKTPEDKTGELIAFFPRKGGDLATKFINKHPDLDCLRLENFTQSEMIFALDASKIYIDFGCFPGKDRIPREALLRDCVIFINNQGCATDFESFPIDNYFRFSEQDVLDGTLYRKVQEVFDDYKNMKEKQLFMKNQIMEEASLFQQRIEEFFGYP
ncbi:hypothetical protein HYV10_03715 [Candidatus Dependentiae bacterium]|nr:hypothetical protein [Candidatus Dependentiae bacterium]